jgi:hypothetical protein
LGSEDGPRHHKLGRRGMPYLQAQDRAGDAAMKWDVTLRFNGRTSGPGQRWRGQVEADCVQEAIDQASGQAIRDPKHGQSIGIVGATIDECRAGSAIRGRCEECDQVWTVAELPLPIVDAANAMRRARCPARCEAKVFLA